MYFSIALCVWLIVQFYLIYDFAALPPQKQTTSPRGLMAVPLACTFASRSLSNTMAKLSDCPSAPHLPGVLCPPRHFACLPAFELSCHRARARARGRACAQPHEATNIRGARGSIDVIRCGLFLSVLPVPALTFQKRPPLHSNAPAPHNNQHLLGFSEPCKSVLDSCLLIAQFFASGFCFSLASLLWLPIICLGGNVVAPSICC